MEKLTHVLIIGFVWPEPNSSAAGSRMMQLIKLFLLKSYQITFASPALDSNFMEDLTKMGINKVSIQLNNESFDEFIKQLQPDVVLFDRFMIEEQFGWRVAKFSPNSLRILDTEDLHCLRLSRQAAWKSKKEFKLLDLNNEVAKREIASILRCDLSLIISEVEMDILKNHFKIDEKLLHYLPFLLDPITEEKSSEFLSFDEKYHFISIGNFLHEPNFNAVLYLKEEIWPLIRKSLPKAELHIYGAYPSQKVTVLHQPKDGFYVKGRAENAKEVVSKARVCLAPLRFGAGLKGKLVEAMQCGTPSVTTTIGSESMHGNLPWSGIIADQKEDFSKGAVELYTNKLLWKKAQENGVNIINKCFSKLKFEEKFIDVIVNLINNIDHHRKSNFMGAMLMHHTLSSTKYMAKWIEAKNKVESKS
jgi:glycosyltransferase involved in cell wall biosynthesis